MTEFAIVRHAVTDWNIQERMQGHRDIPLNEFGLRQAERIALRLQNEHWDAIIYSDLQRAALTAQLIADKAGIEVRMSDSRLRERNLGRLEGTTLTERLDRWGPGWESLEHGVEKDEMLLQRAVACMEELALQRAGQRVIIVSHGGWIREFFYKTFPDLALGRPLNTSLSVVRNEKGMWHCLLFNCINHLKEV